MNVTTAQCSAIGKIWTRVCKDRGWKSGDKALRLHKIGEILERKITTMYDIERIDECTKVMKSLEAMLGVSIQAGKEAVDQRINRKRNWRWIITHELLPCLALYVENGLAGAHAYLLEVMVDKSRWRKTDRPESDPVLTDFDERTVEQIFWTVSARLNDKRKAAGDTGHEMCVAAGVRCKCAKCKRAREAAESPVIPPLPVGTDEVTATAEILKDEDPY